MAAYADLGGFGAEMVCGHHEWAPKRKPDIRDYTMDRMRREVGELLKAGRQGLSIRHVKALQQAVGASASGT